MAASKKLVPSEPRVVHFLDAHHRFMIACAVAVISYVATTFLGKDLSPEIRLLVSWDAFALSVVVLAWIVLLTRDPYEVRRNARLQDASATFLFSIVLAGAIVSLLAVGLLLVSAKGLAPGKLAEYLGVSIAAIGLSWTLVHTLCALRYAHLYYFNARDKERKHATGGLIFPGDESPGYLDFAYFSFVIGMTFQVSDVQISSKRIRPLALIHGLISFCFNTAILALFVNIVASLL